MKSYSGLQGLVTLNELLNQIPTELQESLTSKQLGMVMSAVNAAYHNGRASAGAEVVDDCIWIECLKTLIPLDDIRSIIKNQEV